MVFKNGKVLCDDFRFREVDVPINDGITAVGKRADLFIVDADIRPLTTYVGGAKVFAV